MVVRAGLQNLEYDDDGHLENMQTHVNPDGKRSKYPTIQRLLTDWVPSRAKGGYAVFIEQYELGNVISPEQIERLMVDPHTRMGKRLAGVLSLLVPPDLCCWQQMKNMYERVRGMTGLEEIEISEDAAQKYMDGIIKNYVKTSDSPNFGRLLRVYRRYNLMSQDNLGHKIEKKKDSVSNYELGKTDPPNFVIHELSDALKVTSGTRLLMLNIVNENAVEKLDDTTPKKFRKGLQSITGGGSMAGAMLYRLRHEKRWSLQKLAGETGVGLSTIAHYESGRVIPNTSIIEKLCDALEVDEDTRKALHHSVAHKQRGFNKE